jgi:hypothetical protein
MSGGRLSRKSKLQAFPLCIHPLTGIEMRIGSIADEKSPND